jgi:predicted transcriptional regulator
VPITNQYSVDVLEQVLVRHCATRPVVSLRGEDFVDAVRHWLTCGGSGVTHQGFPVVNGEGDLLGVVTRRDLLEREPGGTVASLIRRAPAVIPDDCTLREALDHLLTEQVGRLVVVARGEPRRPIAMLTRSDILGAHQRTIDETAVRQKSLSLRASLRRARASVFHRAGTAPGPR